MAKGEYNVSDKDNKESENGSAIQDRVENIGNGNNNAVADDDDAYVGYGFKKDESINMKFTLPLIGQLRFNPIVSFFSIVLIWIFVVVCIWYQENVPFIAWKGFIVDKFTWLYIGSQDLWAVFAIILYFSKYADLKLGKPGDKPEYNDVTWFVMLFACGIGVGLFFYGVAEPIFHYTGKNRYTSDPSTPDNTLAQIAINITIYHWGIHSWIVYCLVGLILSLMAYRENLPMTMKSCFYPLIGDRIFGWMGDVIDIISILTTLFGVCTSLGLGTRQLNFGFNVLNNDIDYDDLAIQSIFRYTADPTTPDNTLAQIAINVTLYHWGIHGWIVYCLVGLLLALMSYRENLPMTMKSCFYPLIGDRIFGWLGDAIDIISIQTTLFGVCTSLGLGTRQLNFGFNTINSDIEADNIAYQVAIIWVITAIATVSTVSGVGMGIRRLSETCFGFGMFLMMVALFMDKTFYILNLLVQSLGYYTQFIVQLGWHTDAFEQLGPSPHSELGRFSPEDHNDPDGPDDWMDDWTMFYWGWWISWSPFVGMFIAKISRGRTIRQFINGTLTAPVLYSILWMVIFGGAGIRHEREATNMGFCCPADNESWFLNATETFQLIETRQLEETIIDAAGSYWLCDEGQCGKCAKSVLNLMQRNNDTYSNFTTSYVNLGKDFGSTSPDRSLSKLSCHPTEQMWFDVMRSYGGIGPFMAVFSLFGIVLYFVTSSDSGSLVIDCLSSNGDPDPPAIQRVFWAMMEGATATALLVAGGKKGLDALQTAGIVSGLPYTFIICILCVSLWRAVKVAAGDLDPFGPKFAIGLFDCWAAHPMTQWKKKSREILELFVGFCINIVKAPWTMAEVQARLNNSDKVWAYAIAPTICMVLWIIFHFAEIGVNGMWAIGWFFYLCFATLLASVRIQVRERFEIIGNPFEDFFAALFLYPNVALQMDKTTENLVQKKKKSNMEMTMDPENGKVNSAFEN